MLVEGVGKPEGCKLIRFSADIEGGVLKSIRIRGDFFASPEEGFDRVEERLAGIPLSETEDSFNALLCEEGVEAFGITGAGLSSLLYAASEGKATFPREKT
jgi:lipoate-protein ligase A